MRLKHFYILAFAASFFYFAFTASSFDGEPQDTNKSLIKFSHQFHVENDVECEACHTSVEESTVLNQILLPDMEACSECHDVEDEENCEMCHYKDVYEPLIVKTSELYFNHKFHLTEQKMECQNCHKGLDEEDYSFESSDVNPPMSNCFSCHNNKASAANVCEQCHISTANLLPAQHKEVGFMKEHRYMSMEAGADCAMCHDNNFCEECHVGTNMITEDNFANDFYTPYSPHRYTDNSKMQQITFVHDLNYRYNHGIDAKGKFNECSTCHQTETFCAECHNSPGSGDYALGGFVPSSHTQPNFTTIGVGSGGGLHAEIAGRDIETCAACHDVQGADPNCILCHVDPDGIKGTNPKTHIPGFMEDLHGDWHGDFGTVCYNCHTDVGALSQTKGQGFCGYCHL